MALNLKPGDVTSLVVGGVVAGLINFCIGLIGQSSQNTYIEETIKARVKEELSEEDSEPEDIEE